jgi:hypothetical protein
MKRILIFLAVALAIGALAPAAQADFRLRYSTDGGANFATVATTSSNPGILSGSVGSLQFATSFAFTSISLSTLDLTVSGLVGSAVGSSSINLIVEATVTDLPTAPPPQNLHWHFTSSSTLNGLSETSQGWVDQNNNPYGGATGATSGTNIIGNTGSLTAPSSGSQIFSATPPYSWTLQYTLVGTPTVALFPGGPTLQGISADNNESITTPAPSGLVLAAAGLPLLWFGARFRRYRSAA